MILYVLKMTWMLRDGSLRAIATLCRWHATLNPRQQGSSTLKQPVQDPDS